MSEILSESGEYINADCEACGKTIKVKRQYAAPAGSGFVLNPPVGIKCPCGQIHHSITVDGGVGASGTSGGLSPVRCPKCQSTQLSAGSQGFGLGKAVVGGALLGPVGLLGGLWNANKTKITCLACGHKWTAGQK